MKLKQQQGFTLIELVVVIIILGILAVTAAPKFINFQSDAKEAALKGLQAGIQGANTLVYSKAVLKNQLGATGSISLEDGSSVNTVGGYIGATLNDLNAALDTTLDLAATSGSEQVKTGDWIIAINAQALTATMYAHGSDATCALIYTQAVAGVKTSDPVVEPVTPKYSIISTGC